VVNTDDAAGAAYRLVQDPGDGVQLPGAPYQLGVVSPAVLVLRCRRDQAARGYRIFGTLDAHHFRISQHRGFVNQLGGGHTEHHPTGRRYRFHPLRHPDLLTDRRITQSTRTDVTGNHLAGIKAHPQP
jgi:hypothetical protein